MLFSFHFKINVANFIHVFVCIQLLKNISIFQEQVEEVMMKVCNNLPDPTGDSCMDWLQPHLNMMIDTLHDVPPKEVCRTINACTLVGLFMTPDMYLKLRKYCFYSFL